MSITASIQTFMEEIKATNMHKDVVHNQDMSIQIASFDISVQSAIRL